MGRLIKYEIKGSYKVILAILAIVIILTTVLYTYPIAKNEESPVMALGYILIFGTFLAAFFYIVNSFRKELYEDRGYLTFSLPLTGNQILGAKLIVAVLWFILLGFITTLYNFFMFLFVNMKNMGLTFSEVMEDLEAASSYVDGKIVFWGTMTLFITGILSLILIYFSMTLSRVTLKNKKIGGLWFIVFVILGGLIGYLEIKIVEKFPIYLDISNWKIVTSGLINKYAEIFIGENQNLFFSVDGFGYLNIAGSLFILIIGIILFLSTGYLIENKIDL